MGQSQRRAPIVGALIGLAACGTTTTAPPAPGTGVPGTATPAAPAPRSAPPPATATAAPEQVARDVYRAPGAAATFVYPRLDDARWTHAFARTGDTAAITFTFADGARRARVELRFPPRAGAPADPRALAEATARTLVDQVPGAALRGPGRALPIPGGASWGVAVSAEVQGAPIVAGAVVIADGDAAVAVVTIAHAPLYDDPAVAPVLDAIYQGVRVGGKVLTPPPAQPGRARAGVYLGLGNQLGEYHARIFDPRGYVYDDATVALDLDARYQRARGQADRYVATADAIRVTGADGRSGDELEVRADALALDGHVLCPVAATDGLTLEGRWTAASFTTAPGPHTTFAASTSSRYAFTRDGRFTTATSARATTSDTATGAPEVTAGDHGADRGRYAIAHDQLALTTAAGTARVPIYLRGCGGTPNLGAIVIDGQLYLHDD